MTRTDPPTGAAAPLPETGIPLSEAMQRLTGFEALAVQDHFGRDIESIGGVRLTIGLAWAYANRVAKTSWADVKGRPLRDLERMFTPESVEPEDEAGKAEQPA